MNDDDYMRLADRLTSRPDLAVIGCRQAEFLASTVINMETVYEVRVQGALLAIVKQRQEVP